MLKIKILSLTLIRKVTEIDLIDENRIKGELRINFTEDNKFKMYKLATVENRQYIFPQGVYPIQYEYSPKFKEKLWELKEIPNRSEIKIHKGTSSNHSKGCILLSTISIQRLHRILLGNNKYYINVINN